MMAPATYTSFLIGYALLAAALLAGLYLFFTLKRDIQIVASQQEQHVEAIAERLRQAEEPLLLEAGTVDSGTRAMAYPVRSGFNLNKRVQAMRLLRRGQDISHIAAVLAVPRKEVELLIRVQQMTALVPKGIAHSAYNIPPRVNSAAAGSGGETPNLENQPTGFSRPIDFRRK